MSPSTPHGFWKSQGPQGRNNLDPGPAGRPPHCAARVGTFVRSQTSAGPASQPQHQLPLPPRPRLVVGHLAPSCAEGTAVLPGLREAWLQSLRSEEMQTARPPAVADGK